MLMLGSLVARKLVLWPYSSCVVCRDAWRRKPTMEDDARVLEMNWIFLARLMMLHCLRLSPPYFIGRNTKALIEALRCYVVTVRVRNPVPPSHLS